MPYEREKTIKIDFRRFNRHRLTQINTDGKLQTQRDNGEDNWSSLQRNFGRSVTSLRSIIKRRVMSKKDKFREV